MPKWPTSHGRPFLDVGFLELEAGSNRSTEVAAAIGGDRSLHDPAIVAGDMRQTHGQTGFAVIGRSRSADHARSGSSRLRKTSDSHRARDPAVGILAVVAHLTGQLVVALIGVRIGLLDTSGHGLIGVREGLLDATRDRDIGVAIRSLDGLSRRLIRVRLRSLHRLRGRLVGVGIRGLHASGNLSVGVAVRRRDCVRDFGVSRTVLLQRTDRRGIRGDVRGVRRDLALQRSHVRVRRIDLGLHTSFSRSRAGRFSSDRGRVCRDSAGVRIDLGLECIDTTVHGLNVLVGRVQLRAIDGLSARCGHCAGSQIRDRGAGVALKSDARLSLVVVVDGQRIGIAGTGHDPLALRVDRRIAVRGIGVHCRQHCDRCDEHRQAQFRFSHHFP